jgi:caa(3)-type oxidase subunit IV
MSGHGHTNYVKIWAILVALLVVSIVGPMAEVPWLTLFTAFGIALIKAYLVIKYFMHLPVEKIWLKQLLVVTLAFMGLFFFGVAPDVMNHEGQNWHNDAAEAAVKRGISDPHHEGEGEHGEGEHGEAEAAAGGADITGAWAACASCHGDGGKGDGAAAAALDPKPRDFTDAGWQDKVDDEHLKKVITEGGAAVGLSPLMAPNPSLNPEQVDALVAKIRELKGG